jgi:chromosomal replication initiator protein
MLELIARNVRSNIRELEGALTKLVALASVRGEPPSMELAQEVLRDIIKYGASEVTVEKIKRATAKFCGVRESDLSSSKRSRSIVFPRQVAMYLSRELTPESLQTIGRAFGKKDHTTVLHACRKIEHLFQTDRHQAVLIDKLRKEIESGEEDGVAKEPG